MLQQRLSAYPFLEQGILEHFALRYAAETGQAGLLHRLLLKKMPAKDIVEQLTGYTNTILYDNGGLPSLMVRIPLYYLNEISSVFESVPHPMFRTAKEAASCISLKGRSKGPAMQSVPWVYISKYQNVLLEGRALSLPGKNAGNFLSYDEALDFCRAKGPGWHLMTNYEWAGLALLSWKNHTLPRGNNDSGTDIFHPEDSCTLSTPAPGEHSGRALTGSGPAAWSHDHTLRGVFDCNGNLAEWVGGLRMENGKLLFLDPEQAACSDSQRRESSGWKTLKADGSFAPPSAAHALYFDYTCMPPAAGGTPDFHMAGGCSHPQKQYERPCPGMDRTYGHKPFSSFSCSLPLSEKARQFLKAACILPLGRDCAPGDLYFRNDQESAALRGGHWYHGASAGIFWLNLAHEPEYRAERIGFRCAYTEPADS